MIRDVSFRAYIKRLGTVLPVDFIHFGNQYVGFDVEGRLYEHTFDEVELMQSTEELDSYGNLIFEGDVLENEECERGYVVFNKGSFKLEAITKVSKFFIEKNAKVIGNIYENPELTEEE